MPAHPLNTSGWTRIGPQLGANPGGRFAAPDGSVFYVKAAATPSHAWNEVLAARLYAVAGVRTATIQLADLGGGQLGTASPWIDTDPTARPGAWLGDPSAIARVRKGFAADAWLANWDVVGSLGNVVADRSGEPIRVDLGGALLYRARGLPKASAFGSDVRELDTLRDRATNWNAWRVFSQMTAAGIESSAASVLAIPDAAIGDSVASVGLSQGAAERLETLLIARRDSLARHIGGCALPRHNRSRHDPNRRDPDPFPDH